MKEVTIPFKVYEFTVAEEHFYETCVHCDFRTDDGKRCPFPLPSGEGCGARYFKFDRPKEDDVIRLTGVYSRGK